MRPLVSLVSICCLIAFTSAAPCSDLRTSAQCASVAKCVWDAAASACKCGDTEADFVFLVDESGSVGSSNFDIQKQFLTAVLDQTIPANSGVGVAKFGGGVETVNTLQNGRNLATVRRNLLNMQFGSGATHMGDAVKRALDWLQFSSKPNKIIFLATDGKPNGGAIPDPCSLKDQITNTQGLHVVILGVSSGFDRNKVTCLVQKEGANADKWIITVAQYDRTLLDAILPLLDGRFCPDGFQLKVTEVKPVPSTPFSVTGDDAVFVEIVNQGITAAPLNKIQIGGLFEGFLGNSQDTRVLYTNQVAVVYRGPIRNPRCYGCPCNLVTNSSDSPFCANVLYINCTDANSCRYYGTQGGYNLTHWEVKLSDATAQPAILVDSVTYDTSPANRFPKATPDYTSYELTDWALNNDQGNLWTVSCQQSGSPGSPPANCTGCIITRCQAGGDTAADCSGGGGTTCRCSAQFYLSNGVCLSMFPPAFCTATLVKIRNNSYQVQFAWGAVSRPPGVLYDINYTRDNGQESTFIEIGNSKEITDQQQALFLQQVANGGAYGEVRSTIKYFPPESPGIETIVGSVRVPCVTLTSAPTPSPTRGTTLLWAYFGGDICQPGPPQDRCSCFGQQSNCQGKAGEQIRKTLIGNAPNFLSIHRFPKTYDYPMQIQWVVYDSLTNQPVVLPPSRNRRRLASFALPYNTQACNSSYDICPPWNTTILPRGEIAQIALEMNVRRTTKQYFVRITACASTHLPDPCIPVYPDRMIVTLNGVAPQASNNFINTNTTPEWLWWLIAGLGLLLALALLMAYRWWTRNRSMGKELDTTKKDLDQAITENELGFGHDLGGDVEFNPMATGVPGQAVVADPYGTEIDGRRQYAGGDRADVAVEKFGYRQQLGQVQQGNMGQGY